MIIFYSVTNYHYHSLVWKLRYFVLWVFFKLIINAAFFNKNVFLNIFNRTKILLKNVFFSPGWGKGWQMKCVMWSLFKEVALIDEEAKSLSHAGSTDRRDLLRASHKTGQIW